MIAFWDFSGRYQRILNIFLDGAADCRMPHYEINDVPPKIELLNNKQQLNAGITNENVRISFPPNATRCIAAYGHRRLVRVCMCARVYASLKHRTKTV